MPPAAPDLNRRNRRERAWWCLGAVALVLWVAAGRVQRLEEIEAAEAERLQVQVRAIAQNLEQQLDGMAAALRGLRDDLPQWQGPMLARRAAQRMEAMCAALPGVRTMVLVDEEGRQLADARPEDWPDAPAVAAWFQQLRSRPDASVLYVSPPFRSAHGERVVNLAVATVGADGRFQGAVAATLDGAYFHTLLSSVLYAPDMTARIVHPDLSVLVATPDERRDDALIAERVSAVFSRHLATGQPASVLWAPSAHGGQRLAALRTLSLPRLGMDQPLLLGVGRSQRALRLPWRQQTEVIAASTLGAVLASGLALLALQRRRSEREAEAAESLARQQSDAERLRLALHGADLALWDVDLATGRATVNERWATMLGHTPGQPGGTGSEWEALLHPEDRERVLALQREHLEGRTEVFEATYRLRHRLGHWVWVLDRGRIVQRDAQGRPLRMVGTHLDITARVQAEEELRRNEQSLAITLRSIGDAVIATDAAGHITRINDAARRLTAWEGDSAIGRRLAEVFRLDASDTGGPAPDPVAQVLASGEVVGLANGMRLLARDGRSYQIADSAAPIRDDGGRTVGVVLVFSDVTEQYRVVQALRHSEEKSRALLAALHSGVVLHAPDGRVLDANPAACRIIGLSVEQMRNKPALDPDWQLLEEDGRPMAPERHPVRQVMARGQAVQNLVLGLRHPRLAQTMWALCVAFPLRDAQGALQEIVVTFYDITERQQAEARQRRTAARLRMAGRLARLGGWRLQSGSEQLWLSPEAAEVLGLDPARPVALASVLKPLGEARRAEVGALLHGPQPFELEVDWQADGAPRPRVLRVLGEPEFDEQGRLVAMQGALQDVSESRQDQQQLRLLQTAVAQLNDVVLISEVGAAGPAQDRIVFANAAFERLSGRPAAEVLGQPPAAAGAGLGDEAGAVHEKPLTRADGSACWVEQEVVALRAADGRITHHVAVLRDISERKHAELERQALERQLREAQKIESIGTLAGGIAHDFNNILPAILGNVALARQDLPADHPAVASLEQIHTAGLRARTLVQQILTFSRRQPQALVVQPLQPVIEETLSLLRATLPAAVKLETAITPQVLLVEADATQLQQVVMNLCTNAWQALPEGRGRIEVGLALRDAPSSPAEAGAPAGPRAHLWVADNGCGMAPEVLERIFDPFFTTKPVGQGTGLGLSVVHGIVQLLRGSISVHSTPGQGSRFDLLLPLAVASAPAASPAATPAAGAAAGLGRGGGEKLLYVDDDEVMGLMVQRLLQREGYEVTGLNSPAQALALLRQDPAAFDLVISDFNMPEMSGTELAAQLRQLRPALPVMISSGYISETLREQAAVLGVRALLQKEQTLEALPGLVRQVLDAA